MADDKVGDRLARGLSSLIGEMDKPVSSTSDNKKQQAKSVSSDRMVSIETVHANPNNPRRVFAQEDLEDLSNSIKEHGIVQPILVRPSSDGNWEIVAGERRWRAAQRAGIHSVPIIVREVDNRQALEIAIIENVQRADLNPVEEAAGYQQLMDDYNYKQVDLGKVIGKSRSHVANTLRLLKLPEAVQKLVSSGALSSGHARALVPLDNPGALADRIVREGLSVRQTEELASKEAGGSEHQAGLAPSPKAEKDADTRALEKRLSDVLGLKIQINHKPSGKGRMTIDYASLEQLDELEKRLTY